MKKLNKKFMYKILIIISIVFCVDFFSGIVLEKLYQSCKSGVCYQENYIMRKTNQDLLVFGSSRAAYHYVPSILKDSLGISVYNCGREGTGIYYHYGVLLATLKRYNPKIIFLDIDYRDLYEASGVFGLDVLKEQTPFYNKISPEFDSLLVLSGRKETIKLQSNLYRYNSKAFKIITGNLSKGSDNVLGFRQKNGIWKKKLDPLKNTQLIVDKNKIETLQKFINKTKENNIIFVFTVSPYFMSTPEGLYNPLIKIAKKNKISILNHLQDKVFLSDKSMFNDELHLNREGAVLYSKLIALDAKKVLNLN